MKVVLRSALAIICISAFLIVLHTTVFAQAPEIQWIITFEESSVSEIFNSVLQTTGGGYIMVEEIGMHPGIICGMSG